MAEKGVEEQVLAMEWLRKNRFTVYGQKIFRLSGIANTANERRCIWRRTKDLTFTFISISISF